MIISLIQKYRIQLLGAAVGSIGGYLYWSLIGCQGGQCAIKSNPYWMVGYGVLFGILIFDMVQGWIIKFKKQKNDNTRND
jgi:hypothetical protein